VQRIAVLPVSADYFQAGHASSILVTRSTASALVTAVLMDSHSGGIESLTILQAAHTEAAGHVGTGISPWATAEIFTIFGPRFSPHCSPWLKVWARRE
jgi:hypothetical protein